MSINLERTKITAEFLKYTTPFAIGGIVFSVALITNDKTLITSDNIILAIFIKKILTSAILCLFASVVSAAFVFSSLPKISGNSDPTDDDIRNKAYEIWEERLQKNWIDAIEKLKQKGNSNPTDDDIRNKAYEIWEKEEKGKISKDDWYEAIKSFDETNKSRYVKVPGTIHLFGAIIGTILLGIVILILLWNSGDNNQVHSAQEAIYRAKKSLPSNVLLLSITKIEMIKGVDENAKGYPVWHVQLKVKPAKKNVRNFDIEYFISAKSGETLIVPCYKKPCIFNKR